MKGKSWYPERTGGVPLFMDHPSRLALQELGRGYTHVKDRLATLYLPLEEMEEWAEATLSKQRKERGHIDRKYEEWKREAEALYKTTALFDDLDVSDDKLLELTKKLIHHSGEWWKHGVLIECFDPSGDRIISEEIAPYADKVDELLVESPSNMQRSEIGLWKIREELGKRKTPELMRRLEEHARKYHWLLNSYSQARYLDAKHFYEELLQLEEPKIDWPKRKQLIAEFDSGSAPQEVKNLVYLFRKMTSWREERKKITQLQTYAYDKLAEELSKREGMTKELLLYLDPADTADLLCGRVGYLEAKREECILVAHENRWVWGEDAAKIHDDLQRQVHKQEKELRGTGASRGKIKGTVRVIHDTPDFRKLKKGDILVTGMTRPEFTPILKKAGAIVTDEGGVTCHAAIISRELGIPCVIGTISATHMLKDGDVVEVDADKGEVKLISSS